MYNKPQPTVSNHSLDTISRVSKAIADKVENEEAFTLLDISNAVKSDGGTFISHSDIKDLASVLINNIILNSGYKVDVICVTLQNNTKADARLFSPYWYDPSTYKNTSQVALPPSNVTPTVATAVTVPNTPVKASVNVSLSSTTTASPVKRTPYSTVADIRYDSTVEIPKRVIDEINKLVGLTDFILVTHPHCISLTYAPANSGSNSFKYYPGKRISKTLLKKSNLLNVNGLKFTVYSNKTVISAA